ncbi:MAG: type II secretion system minor pseudopilin GspH [Gammaproteobacteria bacterium]|nr:type II secretion system minor pseudopilin GspH [Gammaproteobacteria bacterium]
MGMHPLPAQDRSRYQAGFTLIEILVVIVIVGTVLSIALLSFGLLGDDREVKTEAHRFVALAELAQDEATMQSREFGIEFMTAGYRFVEYDALTAQWADVPYDDTMRLRALPEGVEFELFLEDKRIVLSNDPAPFEDPDKQDGRGPTEVYAPHLLVYSSGDATPFELHILRDADERRVVIQGNALGQLEIDPEETAP